MGEQLKDIEEQVAKDRVLSKQSMQQIPSKNADSDENTKILIDILRKLQKEAALEKQKEEYRSKYENYKKLCLKEKSEKDIKIKELQVFRDKEGAQPEVKEIMAKYEGEKIARQKEYQIRQDKEAKLE